MELAPEHVTSPMFVATSFWRSRWPARAIHSQNGKTGVVMATEGGSYWTPVSVIATEGDDAHIIPENAGVLYEGIPVLLF